MSIIGRIIGLLLVVALAFGITWCATNWSKVEAEWDKIFNKTPQQEQPNEPDQPTPDKPSEEQINLDGLYYLDVDGDVTFVQVKGSKYGTIHGYIQDSKIYLASDWESEIELEPLHITEDDKYLHVFVTDQENGQEYKIVIYDKATKKLYYDFSNGDQFPGETYEEQLLFEMVKFDEYEISDSSSEVCEHDWVEDLSYVPAAPSCGEYWDTQYKCSKCNETKLETEGPLPHDFVNGVCTRCGAPSPAIISLDGDILTIENYNSSYNYCIAVENEKGFGGVLLDVSATTDLTTMEVSDFFGPCGNPLYVFVCTRAEDYGEESESEKVLYKIPHYYTHGVCSRCGETALTWQIKQSGMSIPSGTTIIDVNFTSNNEQFNAVQLNWAEAPYDGYIQITFINSETSTIKMVFDGSNEWESYGEAYRTITFETAPSGDLLAWLQANATPQA